MCMPLAGAVPGWGVGQQAILQMRLSDLLANLMPDEIWAESQRQLEGDPRVDLLDVHLGERHGRGLSLQDGRVGVVGGGRVLDGGHGPAHEIDARGRPNK